jgi:rod shape-determining protein MreC
VKPSKRLIFVLSIVIAAAVISHSLGWTHSVEGGVLFVTDSVASFISSASKTMGDVRYTIKHLRTLSRENKELQALVNKLQVENVRMKEVEAENRNLRKLLNFTRENPTYAFKGAQVVGKVLGYDPNPFLQYIILDVGSEDGIRVGMPVVTDRGLVGRISEVYAHTSKVLLITDPDSAVSGLLQTSRLTGIVRGQGANEDLLMDYLPQHQKIGKGEIVITSGMGGEFPKNLIIGQVTQVIQRDYNIFQKVVVHPSVDFDRLENVLVITKFSPLPVESLQGEEKKK